MPREGYVGVSLWKPTVMEIDRLIKTEKKLGLGHFSTRPEFLIEAANQLLQKHWRKVNKIQTKVTVVKPKKHG